jgi:hypothetical protein
MTATIGRFKNLPKSTKTVVVRGLRLKVILDA